MANLAVYNGVAFTVSGTTPSVAANATVEVRREDTGALASIYSNEAGTSAITNPSAFADSNGRFTFYALGIDRGYKITVTKDAFSYSLRNQAVGKLAQKDEEIGANVKIHGAVGDGSTDDTAAISAAITSGNGNVFFPAGTYKVTSTIDLPAAQIALIGTEGAALSIITTTTELTNGIFRQQSRGNLTVIRGLRFTGSSIAFNYNTTGSPADDLPYDTQYREYDISNCQFWQSGPYALRFYGAREGFIHNCDFETCGGIYANRCINMEVRGCHFKNTTYCINDDTNEGLKVIGGTALGVTFGLLSSSCFGTQVIGVMWDYCDLPIEFKGCENFSLIGSYVSSRTVNPSVHVTGQTGSPTPPSRYGIIKGNHIPQNANIADDICLRIADSSHIIVSDNDIFNYRGSGIAYTSCTYLDIHNNLIRNRVGVGDESISIGIETDSTNSIHDNTLSQSIVTPTTTNIWNNKGYVTENGGTATITSGNTSVVVTHGLALTPPAQNIDVIFVVQADNDYGRWWVGSITSTQFTVFVSSNPGASGAQFYWKARIKT